MQFDKKIHLWHLFPFGSPLGWQDPWNMVTTLSYLKDCPPHIYLLGTGWIRITYWASFLFFPPPLEVHFRPPTGYPCRLNCIKSACKEFSTYTISLFPPCPDGPLDLLLFNWARLSAENKVHQVKAITQFRITEEKSYKSPLNLIWNLVKHPVKVHKEDGGF